MSTDFSKKYNHFSKNQTIISTMESCNYNMQKDDLNVFFKENKEYF